MSIDVRIDRRQRAIASTVDGVARYRWLPMFSGPDRTHPPGPSATHHDQMGTARAEPGHRTLDDQREDP